MKKRHFNLLIGGLIVLCAIYGIFFKSSAVIIGIANGLTFSGAILIPTIFPFMVVVLFVSKSNISYYLGRLLAPLTKYLFNLPPCASCAVLLSFLGGYPIGAKSASYLYEQQNITKVQAQRISLFAVNPSPAFVVTAVGLIMCNSKQLGFTLLAASIAASVLMGIATGIYSRFAEPDISDTPPTFPHSEPLSSDFITATADATSAMILICAFAILFCACTSTLTAMFTNPIFTTFINYTLEVVIATKTAAASHSFYFLAFVISFGGVSVIFQILAISRNIQIKVIPFVTSRVIHGILAAMFLKALFKFFPITETVISNGVTALPKSYSVSPAASVALIALGMIFLLSMRNKLHQHK